jgi:hypothetical protein
VNKHLCDYDCAEYQEGVCPGGGEFCIIAWTKSIYEEIERNASDKDASEEGYQKSV